MSSSVRTPPVAGRRRRSSARSRRGGIRPRPFPRSSRASAQGSPAREGRPARAPPPLRGRSARPRRRARDPPRTRRECREAGLHAKSRRARGAPRAKEPRPRELPVPLVEDLEPAHRAGRRDGEAPSVDAPRRALPSGPRKLFRHVPAGASRGSPAPTARRRVSGRRRTLRPRGSRRTDTSRRGRKRSRRPRPPRCRRPRGSAAPASDASAVADATAPRARRATGAGPKGAEAGGRRAGRGAAGRGSAGGDREGREETRRGGRACPADYRSETDELLLRVHVEGERAALADVERDDLVLVHAPVRRDDPDLVLPRARGTSTSPSRLPPPDLRPKSKARRQISTSFRRIMT